MKSLLLIPFCLLALAAACQAQIGGRFNSIVVRPEGLPHRNNILIDFDQNFAWMGQHYGNHKDAGGNTVPAVLVYSKSHGRWLQIVEVSTAQGTFGKSPPDALIQAPWDFTSLASKDSVPLPIPTGGAIHLPDKVTFDESQNAFVLHFDSRAGIESMTTKLLIPKKDLTDAFDHYIRSK